MFFFLVNYNIFAPNRRTSSASSSSSQQISSTCTVVCTYYVNNARTVQKCPTVRLTHDEHIGTPLLLLCFGWMDKASIVMYLRIVTQLQLVLSVRGGLYYPDWVLAARRTRQPHVRAVVRLSRRRPLRRSLLSIRCGCCRFDLIMIMIPPVGYYQQHNTVLGHQSG